MGLGNLVGIGGSAEVYEYGEGKVLKLFHQGTNEEVVKQEFNSSLMVWESGLPAARPYEWLWVEGRYGIIFEKISGFTVSDWFTQLFTSSTPIEDESNHVLRRIARLLYRIHHHQAPHIVTRQTSHLKGIIHWISCLTDDEKETICDYMDRLPVKEQLCHGDINPGNIVIQEDGERMLDWRYVSKGDPAADIAEFSIMLQYAHLPPDIPPLVREYLETSRYKAHEIFIDEYTKLSGITQQEIEAWTIPVMARKLASSVVGDTEQDFLLSYIRTNLHRLT